MTETVEDIKQKLLTAFHSAIDEADKAPENQRGGLYRKAAQDYLDALTRAGINDSITTALQDIVKMPVDQLKSLVGMVFDAGKSKVNRTQQLQEEQARMIMNTMAGPDKMRMQVATIATFVSMILRYFGKCELADRIDAMSASFTAGVERRLKGTLDASGITGGQTIIDDTGERFRAVMDAYNAGKKTVEAANDAANASGQRGAHTSPVQPFLNAPPPQTTVPTPPPSGSPLPSGAANKPLTWDEFKANLAAIGLNLPHNILAKTEAAFLEAAKTFGETDPTKASLSKPETGFLEAELNDLPGLSPDDRRKILDVANAHALPGPS